ncbi:hypothetical protein HDV01_000063 [Terramyces sp. JEL0728]|nr:hypothetical protein HDV01_000063 [Terramyces sp. JEL0728]
MEFPKVPIFLLVALLALLIGLRVNGVFDMFDFSFEPAWMYPNDKPTDGFPHSNYLKYIPTNPDDPEVPLDINREYTFDDFQKYFNVHPLHEVVLDSNLKMFLEMHGMTMETESYRFPPELEGLAARAKMFIDLAPTTDDRFVVKWSCKEYGFGVFAKKPISKGDIIGVYTGVVNLYVDPNSDYLWDISQIKLSDGQLHRLGINGRRAGNYLRFVNHIGETGNVKPIRIPHKGKIHCVYFADKDIDVGEELLTDYGENYFKNRKMVLPK